MGRRPRLKEWFDTELAELPEELRWREWMGRVEAVIFACPTPVSGEALARAVPISIPGRFITRSRW